VMARLTAAAEQVLAQPQIQKRLRELGYEPAPPGGPSVLTRRIVDEIKLVRETAQAAGVAPE
jgi:tripartite-type tricarboxylate transporter receptor subunit TctC